jgi:hypothetical protein
MGETLFVLAKHVNKNNRIVTSHAIYSAWHHTSTSSSESELSSGDSQSIKLPFRYLN